MVCPNNVWAVTHWVKLKAKLFASWGNQRQAENQWRLLKLYTSATITGGVEDICMDNASKVLCGGSNQLYSALCTGTSGIPHRVTDTPIVPQPARTALWGAH